MLTREEYAPSEMNIITYTVASKFWEGKWRVYYGEYWWCSQSIWLVPCFGYWGDDR